jgi:glycosyltransferase involved in cell wall biosynthesis
MQEITPPLFSIILPTFNRAYVLWRAVESVLAQTEPRWELLVVNDGSTDETLRVLEEFHDPRICVFTTPNRGAAAARNFGITQAAGELLAYIDSDNAWHPDFLATMHAAVHEHPDGVLWYCGQRNTLWERTGTGKWKIDVQVDVPRAQYSLEDVMRIQGADTNCIVHTRAVIEATGGWDETCRFLEDWDFFARCMQCFPNRMYWVPRLLVEYRQVYGVGVDGMCAVTVQDPLLRQARWQYLMDKWKDWPVFVAAAQKILDKHRRKEQKLSA